MIHNIVEMNWTEFASLNREKTVAFLGFAPIEQHGRHLPLGVDVYETQYWLEAVIKELDQTFPTYQFLQIPLIPYGHAEMKGFPGNIHLSQKLMYELVYETLQNVVEWGVENIVVLSGHADPKHAIAIEQACDRVKRETGISPFAPMGAIF